MQLDDILPAMRRFSNSKLTATSVRNGDVTVSFQHIAEQVEVLVSVLRTAGMKPGFRIGLSLGNCYEFVVWDLAAIQLGAVLQVFPEDYQPSDKEWLDPDIRLWVHGGGLALNPQLNVTSPVLDLNVCIDVTAFLKSMEICDIEETTVLSQKPDPDLHSMVYSSGTSGYLKGLKISRKGTEKLMTDFLSSFSLTECDIHLIFLPLSNYQQRLSAWVCLLRGVDITLTEYINVFRELSNVKPTFIIAPPVIYENIYQLFAKQVDCQRLVREFLGGKMRFMITGMAPIKTSLLQAYNKRVGVCLLEAYGVTETGMIAWNTPEYNRQGSVGRAVHASEVSLSEDGELLVHRDDPLCMGYFQADASDTVNTFLPSGKIATGDIAKIDEDGYITLKGRKKDIVVTNAGVKFHPERVEHNLDNMSEIVKSVVLWDHEKNKLYCVIKINNSQSEIQTSSAQIDSVIKQIDEFNHSAESYMQITSLIAVEDEFSIENGLLTRNMKINRNGFAQKYLARLRSENLLVKNEEKSEKA